MTPNQVLDIQDFSLARQAMIDSQIHPMGVISEPLLEAFQAVPREMFVPEALASICYCDEDIEIAPGRYLMEPAVLGRMIQALNPNPEQVALTIGSGIGYNAAILSHLVTTVVALEEDLSLIKQAQASWDSLSCCNIVAVTGPQNEGAPVNAPYDIIVVNGSVASVPEEIKKQLTIGGRLVVPVKPASSVMADVILIERVDDENFVEKSLFSSGTPYLQGFEPAKEFVF